MASLNMALRQDDGSFTVLDMDLTDEDSQTLVTALTDFLRDHSDRLKQPAQAPQMASAPVADPPSSVDSEYYNPMDRLVRGSNSRE